MRTSLPLLLLIILPVATTRLIAQGSSSFCSNTALVPVFKQDFGSGANASAITTAPPGSTNYNFGWVGTDGNYIVTPRVDNAGKSDWTKGGDHTGNPNGNMFLVNAGGNRSIFLQQNVSGLCPGSSYSFTAWLANVNTITTKSVCGSGLVYSKITFNIKDTANNLLATYTTDTLPLSPVNGPPNWKKYGFQFSLPTNTTSLKLEIVDYWGGGPACGNDVALDDILFEACVPQITVSLAGNADVCVGDSGKLQTTLINSPYTNPAYLWQKSKDGGTTWNNLTATPNDTSIYFFNNVVPANSGLYRVLVAPTAANIYNQYCSAISNTVFYTVNSLPLLQPVTNAPLCTGNTLQLKANASGGSGIYAAYKWTGPNNFLSLSADTNKIKVSRKDTGTYIIKVTDSKGCKNTASLFVAIDSTPVLTTLSVTDTICSGNIGKASVLSSVNTSAYYWNASLLAGTVGNIGNIINPEYSGTRSAVIINTGNIPARIKYSVFAKNNNCTSNTLDTIITIMPATSLAKAGKDTSICSSTNLFLHANSPTYGSGTWKQISGPSTVTFSDAQMAQPSISNLVPGLYSFEWRITGYCGTNADTVSITFINKPTPSFSISDTLICAGNSITLTNTTQNSILYSYNWDFGNGNHSNAANPPAIAFTGSSSGKDTTYTITLKAFTSCDTISISKKIIVRSKPTIKFSVQTDSNCFPINANFNFASTADSTLQKINFGDSGSTLLQHTSSINHTYQSAFNKTFYPTYISSNSCGTDSLQLSIIGYQKPILTFTKVTDTVCAGTNAQIIVNSTIPNSKFYWYSKQYIASDSSTRNISTSVNTSQQYTIYDSIYAVSLGGCKSNTIATTITVLPLSNKASAGHDSIICNTINFTLYANTPVNAIGFWQQILGPVTISFTDSTLNTTRLSGLTPGNYKFTWNIKGYCATSADTINIRYLAKPTPSFTLSDTLVCSGNSVSIKNTTSDTGSYNYQWDLGNGNFSSNTNISAITYTGSSSGKDTTYIITLKAFTACDTISISKKITVRSKPTIKFSVQTDSNCFPINANFNFASTADSTLQKINFGDSGSALLQHTSSINHTYQSAFNKTFYPTYVSSNSCGADSLQLSIIGFQKPILTFTKVTDTVCAGTNAQIIVNSTIPNSKFYWYSKQYIASDSSTRNISTSVNTSQQYTIYDSIYAVSLGGCKSNTIATTITVLPLSNKASAGHDSIICNTINFALYANTPVNAIGFWQQIMGPVTISFTDSTLNSTRLSGLTPGNYKFAWHIKGYCATSADTINIRYLAKPTPSFTLSDTLICSGKSIMLTNTTQNSTLYSYNWDFGNGNHSNAANPPAIAFIGSSSGKDTTYTITLKAFTACDTISISKKITVRSKPIASLIATPLNLCLPLKVKFLPTTFGAESTRKFLFEAGKDSLLLNDSSFIHTYFGNTTNLLQPQLILTNICGTDTAVQYINAIANSLQINNNLADTSICGIPYTASFTNNTSGANAQFWNWGDGSINNNPTQTLTHTYTRSGIYSITHSAKHVCGDTVITKTIRLNKIPHSVIQAVVNNICVGDTVLLSTNIDSSINYKWVLNNTIIDSSAKTKYIFTTPGVYTPILFSSITTNGFTCIDSNSIKIQILGEKPGKAVINPTNGFCVPFTVKLISKSLPAASVSWSMGTDSTIFGDSTLFTYTQGGDYWVKMKAKTKGGCIFTDSTFISIRSPQGTVNFKSGTYCNNNFKVIFTPTVLYTDRIAWDFGDGTTLETGVQNITHQYTKPGIYYPIVTLISNTGCRIQLPIHDSIVMENVKASFTTKTIFECGNTLFQFTDSSAATHGIANYTWLTDSKIISTAKTASSNFYLTGTHKTELLVTGKYGCSDTVSGTYNVPIYNLPKVNINAINEACLNSLMEFKSEISSIDSVIMRLWNLGNGKTLTDSTVHILYYDQGKYTVKLTVATINKCYDSALKQITIHPVPQVKVAGPEKICAGETVELQAAGATNFVWKDQQENIICNNCLTVKVKPLRSTQYKVIGYNEFGCTQVNSTNIQVIDKIKMKVIPEDTICIGQSVRLWASGATYYQWLPAIGLNNYTIATPTATPSATTAYRVVGKDINNCFTDTATVRVVVGNPTPLMVGKDSSFVAGSKIQLHANTATANIVRWKWAGGSDLSCVNCPNPIARVIFDECISCAATNIYGCISKDTVCFKTFCPTTEVFLPNAFTPDGDGINDVFYVQAKGVRNIKSLRVFNRWGELVFEKTNILPNDAGSGWNGKIRGVAANPDVYVYFCEVVCEKGGTQLYKGNVAIIR